jgi:hypothetical protein
MIKPLFLAAITIVIMSLFTSCDSHHWDDHPEKGSGSKHLFKGHSDSDSHESEVKQED